MQKYACKNCDAELFWDSQSHSLKCEYCDSSYQPSDFEDAKTHQVKAEQVTIDENTKSTDGSEGLEYLKYQCTNCGAEVITVKGTVVTTCAYCGRALVITDKLVDNFRPHAVIPFSIIKKRAMKIYEDYCKESILTPKKFKDPENIKKIKGIYAPFWLHSFKEDANVELMCERVSSHRRGNDKVVTTKEYRVDMNVTGNFEKIPIDALTNLDNQLVNAIEPYNYSHLQNFNAAYMAGFYAEEYNEDAHKTFDYAHDRAVETIKNACTQATRQYTTSKIANYNGDFTNRKASYVMLPIWLINTEYKGKMYTFAINGDTGKITGKMPMSIIKLILSALIVFCTSYLACWLCTFLAQ